MKSKEQVLDLACIPITGYVHFRRALENESTSTVMNIVNKAMDDFAQERSVGFAEWTLLSGYGYIRGMGWKHVGDIVKSEIIPTTQLYQQFIDNLNK